MHRGTIRVLLVEDEEAHAELIRLSCESRADIRLSVATSLGEARARLAESSPDLVIVDSLLPDGRGLDLARERGGDEYPVILMTSHADAAMEAEALKAGISRYVVKSEATLLAIPEIVDGELG